MQWLERVNRGTESLLAHNYGNKEFNHSYCVAWRKGMLTIFLFNKLLRATGRAKLRSQAQMEQVVLWEAELSLLSCGFVSCGWIVSSVRRHEVRLKLFLQLGRSEPSFPLPLIVGSLTYKAQPTLYPSWQLGTHTFQTLILLKLARF